MHGFKGKAICTNKRSHSQLTATKFQLYPKRLPKRPPHTDCASQNYCLRELFMLHGCMCYAGVVNCVYLNLTRIPAELERNSAENGTQPGRFSDTQVL